MARFFPFVKRGVFFRVDVRVNVRATVGVDVKMFMGPVPPGPPKAPDKIRQPEGHPSPRGQIAAKGFDGG